VNQPLSTGPLAPAGASPAERVVIHQLADLHRSRSTTGRSALEAYTQRLYYLPAEQQPDVIIVIGDLTLTGSRDELREAANDLRSIAQARQWDAIAQRQRIFVVPGPHDIDWSNQTNAAISLEGFAQAFAPFCIPALPGREGRLLTNTDPFVQSAASPYIVYLINTCIVPEALPQPTPKAQDEIVKRYRALWKERARAVTRAYDDASIRQFVQGAEEILAQDAGAVRADDVARFTSTLASVRATPGTAAPPRPLDPSAGLLKILVSHHPLIGFTGLNGRSFASAIDAGALVSAARRFGVQVALHGHAHEPHVTSDLAPDGAGPQGAPPLLHIGAGAVGNPTLAAPTYTELVATRDRATGRWNLSYAPVTLGNLGFSQRPPEYAFPLYSLIPTPKLNTPRPDAASAATRAEFESRLRVALRLLAEEVDNDAVQDIPVRPLETIKETIKDTIFMGIETRIGLALKQRRPQETQIVLANRYIFPDVQADDQYLHPFPYPDTVAAWTMIQGEPLIYPTQVRGNTAPVNYDWLRRTGKYDEVLRALDEALLSDPGSARLNDLRKKLDGGSLAVNDIFQPWLDSGVQTRFTTFISMPIPLRAQSFSAARPREIGTLNVDIIDPDPMRPGESFTPERLDMLRSIATAIDLILTTADKFRRPRGVWHLTGF
jgi:predicted phosphodiesterase